MTQHILHRPPPTIDFFCLICDSDSYLIFGYMVSWHTHYYYVLGLQPCKVEDNCVTKNLAPCSDKCDKDCMKFQCIAWNNEFCTYVRVIRRQQLLVTQKHHFLVDNSAPLKFSQTVTKSMLMFHWLFFLSSLFIVRCDAFQNVKQTSKNLASWLSEDCHEGNCFAGVQWKIFYCLIWRKKP